jgi:nicotinamide riboside kinase
MLRRINFIGGPGIGKSTIASYVYSHLKRDGFDVELIDEFVKAWAYEGKPITSYDQLFIFANQIRKEEIILRNDVDFIITDSPIILTVSYAKKHHFAEWESLQKIHDDFEKEYSSLNVVLRRQGVEYEQSGRFETQEEAESMDRFIKKHLKEHNMTFVEINARYWHKIYDYVKNALRATGKR